MVCVVAATTDKNFRTSVVGGLAADGPDGDNPWSVPGVGLQRTRAHRGRGVAKASDV